MFFVFAFKKKIPLCNTHRMMNSSQIFPHHISIIILFFFVTNREVHFDILIICLFSSVISRRNQFLRILQDQTKRRSKTFHTPFASNTGKDYVVRKIIIYYPINLASNSKSKNPTKSITFFFVTNRRMHIDILIFCLFFSVIDRVIISSQINRFSFINWFLKTSGNSFSFITNREMHIFFAYLCHW